jgi:pyruvate formate lyase activating enzyme
VKALLQEALPNGKTRCNACAWKCQLAPGAVGICRVREADESGVIQYTGAPSMSAVCPLVKVCAAGTFCIGAPAGSPAGCNWGCSFCSSAVVTLPEAAPVITPKEAEGHGMEPWPEDKPIPLTMDGFLRVKKMRGKLKALEMKDGLDINPETIIEAWRRSGKPGFAVRSTEPAIHVDSLRPVFKGIRAEGGHVAFNTNAYWTPELVELLAPHVDQIEIGIKGSGNEEFLRKVAGVPRMGPVWDTFRALSEHEHIDLLVSDIPVIHDTWKEDFQKLVSFIAEHVPARDYPRLTLRPWAGDIPFKAFGKYKAAAPYSIGTSRVLLVSWATRIALSQLDMVWVEGLTTREQTGFEEVLHGFAIAREGKLQRVARNTEALGDVLELTELDLDPEQVVEAARIRMREDNVQACP